MAGDTSSDTGNYCMTGMPASPKVMAYAGDVSPEQAYASIADQLAVLVDVRTPEEWSQGQPDLSATPGKMVSVSLKILPGYALNPKFAAEVAACESVGRNTRLFFMCRGGGRSREAASMMAALGYTQCFNISGGFEGYKSSGLPWKQYRIAGQS